MSLRLSRALKREFYTPQDQAIDKAWTQAQPTQILLWDAKGYGHALTVSRVQVEKWKNQVRERDWNQYIRWLKEAIQEFENLFGYQRDFVDEINQLKITLKEMEREFKEAAQTSRHA